VATLIIAPPPKSAGVAASAVALIYARDCVEPTSYHVALSSAQAPEWKPAMQQEYDSLMDNGTRWPVDLTIDRTVVKQHVDLQDQVGHKW
jgi:hypothetical protein